MALSPVPASGQIVLVTIDAKSLEAVGTWPWSRQVHADLLDRMTEAGALDVLFDIDFAFAADPPGDDAFVAALERASSAVYLAAFGQNRTLSADGVRQYNLPHDPFRSLSWIASANVSADASGTIRRYPFGTDIEGEFVPSAGAVLAGHYVTDPPDFGLNLAFMPATVPTYSLIDVIDGIVPAEALEGRSVVVGASAVELGDFFPVPVHGLVPGALVHVFAAETLIGNLAVLAIRPAPVVALFVFVMAGLARWTGRRPWRLVAVLGLGLLIAEIAALVVFRTHQYAVPTAILYPAVAIFGLGQLARSLDLTRLMLWRKDIDFENTRRLLRHLFNESHDAVVILSDNGTQLLSNPSAETLFGRTKDGLIDVPSEVAAAAKAALASEHLNLPMRGDLQTVEIFGPQDTQVLEFSASTSSFRLESSGDRQSLNRQIATITARDVTTVRQQERQIAYLSAHDEYTGALRRNSFLEVLQEALDHGASVAVFALDLRRFSTVNVTLGRSVGDAVLAEVVRRLNALAPAVAATVRLDGDGFGFFTSGLSDADAVSDLAAQVQAAISSPYEFGSSNAQVGVRLGYEFCDSGAAVSAEQALLRAEEALDTNRDGGAPLYDPEISRARQRARALEQQLAQALENEEFHLAYQPQVRASDGVLVGVEALLRWTSPTFGSVSPAEFTEIAEASGFIHPLGSWVLQRAIQDAAQLPEDVEVAVNVSGAQLQSGDITGEVKSALAASELNPRRLCLEVTETVLLTDAAHTIETMRDTTWLGAKWALDDFGTGYSSLSYLSGMPLSKIKLDRAFVSGLGTDPSAMAVLRSVRTLCDGLALELLCEGAETAEQVEMLRREGCDTIQGFYFGRPAPIEQIATWCSVSGAEAAGRDGQ